jgi:hypothetical protein
MQGGGFGCAAVSAVAIALDMVVPFGCRRFHGTPNGCLKHCCFDGDQDRQTSLQGSS